MRRISSSVLMILCLLLGIPLLLSASTELPLDNIQYRKQVLEERKGIDCSGIYKQTQLKFDAILKILNKVELTVGLKPEQLVQLTTMTAALGQKRREFCEYYKHTPEWNKEEYFRTYGEMEKQDSDIDKMLQAIVEQARAQKGAAKAITKLTLPSLETVPVAADDTFDTLAEKLETQITSTPVLPEPNSNARRLREWRGGVPLEFYSRFRLVDALLSVLAGLVGALGIFGVLRLTGVLRK